MALILYKNNIQLSYLQICMIIFTQTEQALILYKNNIQQERKAKRKECIYTALILYKNNIQPIQKQKKNYMRLSVNPL